MIEDIQDQIEQAAARADETIGAAEDAQMYASQASDSAYNTVTALDELRQSMLDLEAPADPAKEEAVLHLRHALTLLQG